jgi:hypothetical protein
MSFRFLRSFHSKICPSCREKNVALPLFKRSFEDSPDAEQHRGFLQELVAHERRNGYCVPDPASALPGSAIRAHVHRAPTVFPRKPNSPENQLEAILQYASRIKQFRSKLLSISPAPPVFHIVMPRSAITKLLQPEQTLGFEIVSLRRVLRLRRVTSRYASQVSNCHPSTTCTVDDSEESSPGRP